MQMATRHAQLTAGDEAARVFGVAALVGCGFHF
jgi:tetrahydromethanopterin S-methyltransferase subunit F